MSSCRVSRILVFPIKSLDGVSVPEAKILASGALRHDREFALEDDRGNFINGKRTPRAHLVRARFDLARMAVELEAPGAARRTFDLEGDIAAVEVWFSEFFGVAVRLKRDAVVGFPDDLDSPGPTIAGTASVREVQSWFSLATDTETLLRFRTNIELETEEPFWEDRLFGAEGSHVAFKIGDVNVHGINPCQRCPVPTRDPSTGAVTPDFQRTFAERRAAGLPAWSERSRFNHFYRFSVNTRIPASEAGKILRVGDELAVQAIAPPGQAEWLRH